MKEKRLTALLASVAVISTMFAGCSTSSQNTKKPAESTPKTTQEAPKETKKIKVGLSTDEGGLNDKSFNQAADTGIKKAVTDFGIDYKPIESSKKEDYEPNLEALISDNSDLTFAVGFQMQDALTAIAKKYPNKKFAIIDTVVDAPNVESIGFKEQEGSFLMGVIAGKVTKSNKVGFIGGKDFDLINKFEAGYVAGVKSVNPEAAKGVLPSGGKPHGVEIKYADSFIDANKGYELAKALIADGCDVIYHAAGAVGTGMFKAVKEANDGGKKVWAIGVDMDQAVSIPEYATYILSSMVKRVDTATYTATKDVINNSFQGGKAISLGLKEDGVNYAPSSNKNTPADVLTLLDKYKEAIKSGTINVPVKPADAASFNAPTDIK